MPIVEVIKSDEVTLAQMDHRDGYQCIRLSFKNHEDKFLNLEVFSRKKKTYEGPLKAYRSLVGKTVRVTCWDPQQSPGKWSSKSWFKNILVLSKDEKTNAHITSKGICDICGIADGLLNYSHAKRNAGAWFHFSCMFKVPNHPSPQVPSKGSTPPPPDTPETL